jgi:CHAD domain-containing protein
MSYDFTRSEPVPLAARRIVREEIAFATDSLKVTRAADRDDAIHEVRKSVKRVRSLLKLLRPVLGDRYDLEAGAWRNLGQILSGVRDAEAMLELFEELRPQCPARLYAPLHRRLARNKHQTLRDIDLVMTKLASGLKRSTHGLKSWRMEDRGFQTIATGWKQTYRRGARAVRAAEKDASPENLHRLRKRTKEHFFQLRLLKGLWDGKLRSHKAKVERLEEMLGSHHNLVVLKTAILQQPAVNAEEFLRVLDKMEKDLARKALKLAAMVYAEPTSRITQRVEQRWERWTDL